MLFVREAFKGNGGRAQILVFPGFICSGFAVLTFQLLEESCQRHVLSLLLNVLHSKALEKMMGMAVLIRGRTVRTKVWLPS